MNKQDIVVHIKDEAMLNEAREILESAGEIPDLDNIMWRLDKDEDFNNLQYGSHSGKWFLSVKTPLRKTEITLTQLKELLNK